MSLRFLCWVRWPVDVDQAEVPPPFVKVSRPAVVTLDDDGEEDDDARDFENSTTPSEETAKVATFVAPQVFRPRGPHATPRRRPARARGQRRQPRTPPPRRSSPPRAPARSACFRSLTTPAVGIGA